MSPASRRLLWGRVLPLVFLLGAACSAAAQGSGTARGIGAAGVYPFIFFGRVLIADVHGLDDGTALRSAGRFSPVATTIAADAAGRIWGRLEPSHLAALDPESDRIVLRVRLPHKPGEFLITPTGKAYVTHRSPSRGVFPLSALDTNRGVPLGELQPLAGRPEDMARAAGFVYVAALGVLRADPMQWHLYRIDEATDGVREVLDTADTAYSWKLASAGERLYLGYLPAPDSSAAGRVEVRDARSFDLLHSRDSPRGPLRGLYAMEDRVLLFCAVGDEGTDLVVLDPLLKNVSRVGTLEGPVDRVLGVHGDTLVYLDHALAAGPGNVALRFYDLASGGELKRIKIRDYLIAEGGQ